MFARLFSSKRTLTTETTTTTTTTTTATDTVTPAPIKPAEEVNGKARMSPSSLTEPGSIATNSHTNTVPDSPSRGALLRSPSPSRHFAGADAESLKELFKSCPPKIVYSYLTSQIVNGTYALSSSFLFNETSFIFFYFLF